MLTNPWLDGTPRPYTVVGEVKFNYKDERKEPKLCQYFTQNRQEEDEREDARRTVKNIILASPFTPTQEPRQNFIPSIPDFSFPDISPIFRFLNPFDRPI